MRTRPRATRIGALSAAAVLAATCFATLPARADLVAEPISSSADGAAFELTPIGQYQTGTIDEGASEIVAHHPATQRMLVVNAAQGSVDVLDVSDPTTPTEVGELDATPVTADGASANSVAVRADGLVAVAVEAPEKTDTGWVVFFDAAGDGEPLGVVEAGALPDMVTISPDGGYALVANEGEPAEDYSVDPEGTISVVALPDDLEAPGQDDVRTADFADVPLPDGLHLAGPTADGADPVLALLEPEYITVAGETAYVSLQDNNAIAVVDVERAEVTDVWALGVQDRREVPADLSDEDGEDGEGAIDIATHPVSSMFQPDAISSYTVDGETYLVTANEGDSRDWEGYSEEARVADLGEDGLPPLCEDAEAAAVADEIGRLTISTAAGLSEDGSCIAEPTAFGGRSFSILDSDGDRVFDSADAFEQITAAAVPDFFNSNHSESNLDGRSDDKGPEPEAITIGELDGRVYAFVGFERIGGVAVFDVTEPTAAAFVTYVNNRDFSVSVEDDPDGLAQAGDLGPESVVFIAAESSPTGEPLLAVGNEVSGTTTLYALDLTEQSSPEPTPEPTATPEPLPTPEPTPTGQPTPEPTPGQPTPTAEPTGSPSADPVGADDDADQGTGSGTDGDDLADTGLPAGTLAAFGLALIALAGSAALLGRVRS
ncbi:alkaline phosphatase [Desertihabitans brevis]|uniref:Alkaline phosphatase n=1 Tax=Desertihabitans brevis TaxID=2268447 RepID=A0A367YVJ3_9ACTN|nr:choice-of-anchor I family protein [Desertihabitans brevis]RCK69906.1 alkaline phosphatase [Desertihabitans brevis]